MKKFTDYTKEQLRELSLTELAYIYLSGRTTPVSFDELATIAFTTIEALGEKDAKLGQFYTDLTIDGRFVTFSNGKWDLRYRHRFEAFDLDEELPEDEKEIEVEESPLELTTEEDEGYEGEEKKPINVEEIIQRSTEEEYE